MSEQEAAPAATAEQGSRNLLLRIGAAVVLAPATLAVAYAGGWLWATLATAASIGLYVEWLMIVGAARERRVAVAGGVALAIAGLCLASGRIEASLVVLALGCAAATWLTSERRLWAAAGFFYASAAEVASVLVRLDEAWGFVALILILLVVWVTDIGGFFAGRGLGGPKLWPRVSPKKTWAGALGGFAASLVVAAGFVVAGFSKAEPLKLGPILLVGAALSVVSQLGDLFEFRREAAVRRQGLQPADSRAWRTDGSSRRVRSRGGRGRDFWLFARRRG